jgi:hypothetical protein
MDKKIAGLLGAAAALTTITAAQRTVAEPAPSAPTLSYRDLLEPMPDALAALRADDARLAEESRAKVQVAQYYYHHHHHHHGYFGPPPRRYLYHHHHHHHHHQHGGFGVYIR